MIKKIFLAFLILGSVSCWSWAAYDDSFTLNRASFTKTNEGPIAISTYPGMFLVGVLVSSASAATGLITLYDSNGVVSNTLGAINLGTVFYAPFEVKCSSGITYTTTGNSAGVTIIWKDLRIR